MPETKVQAPGSFCWSEVCTTDPEAARKFYGELFGWTAEEVPSDGGAYTMLRLDGQDVGGMYQLAKEQVEQGVPPHWMAYVLVEDLDATTAKISELGGKVVMGPMDVMDVGRMTLLQDPTGAVLSLWQAKSHKGGAAIGVPNSPCWFELISTDMVEATAFYAGLFGWELETWHGEGEYILFKNGETSIGGAMQRTPEMGEVPSHWITYFSVTDCDAAADKAAELGGRIINPPMDIPNVGRFALMADPVGAMFAVIKLA